MTTPKFACEQSFEIKNNPNGNPTIGLKFAEAVVISYRPKSSKEWISGSHDTAHFTKQQLEQEVSGEGDMPLNDKLVVDAAIFKLAKV